MKNHKKRALNVVKVDLGELAIKKSKTLPVIVQHLSKDGRRIEQTVHEIPAPQPNPLLLAFDPSPVVPEDNGGIFLNTEPSNEGSEDRVRSHFSLFRVSYGHVGCSGIHCGYGVQNAMFFFKNLSCWRVGWSSAMGTVTFVQNLVCPLPIHEVCLNNPLGSYRCLDCVGGFLCCGTCIVGMHTPTPFHRIQVRPYSAPRLSPF